jgi:hypothetical protein
MHKIQEGGRIVLTSKEIAYQSNILTVYTIFSMNDEDV